MTMQLYEAVYHDLRQKKGPLKAKVFADGIKEARQLLASKLRGRLRIATCVCIDRDVNRQPKEEMVLLVEEPTKPSKLPKGAKTGKAAPGKAAKAKKKR
jgi:hypothetical protein